jgi:hypothetical protein
LSQIARPRSVTLEEPRPEGLLDRQLQLPVALTGAVLVVVVGWARCHRTWRPRRQSTRASSHQRQDHQRCAPSSARVPPEQPDSIPALCWASAAARASCPPGSGVGQSGATQPAVCAHRRIVRLGSFCGYLRQVAVGRSPCGIAAGKWRGIPAHKPTSRVRRTRPAAPQVRACWAVRSCCPAAMRAYPVSRSLVHPAIT